MKKIIKILTILMIIGLLFMTGIGVNDNDFDEVSYKALAFGGVRAVSACHCPPPDPGYPDNCHPGGP